MTAPTEQAQALRAFTRFYTRRVGVLGDRLQGSRFSLAQARLLWELAATPGRTASTLAAELQLDAGYLSRVLAGLRERGLVKAHVAAHDRRQTLLSLSAAGRRALAPLDKRSQAHAMDLLAPLSAAQRLLLLQATRQVETLLGDTRAAASPPPVELRALRNGDLGWVVARHGALYAHEYGLDLRFEALVARIGADFIDRFDPAREAAWIADQGGTPLGCVFLVQARHDGTAAVEPGVAQLRLLLVEPEARGQGVGRRLAAECERFARAAGYARIRLWTNRELKAARAIYAAAGYRLVASEAHTSFGRNQIGETWEKDLSA